MLGLDNKEKINVKGVQVAPRDVVAACLPDPARLGDKMTRQDVRRHVGQRQEGRYARDRSTFTRWLTTPQCMKRWGCQAVVAQTAFSPVIGWDLIEHGAVEGNGRARAGGLRSEPFMAKMAEYEFPYGMLEMPV